MEHIKKWGFPVLMRRSYECTGSTVTENTNTYGCNSANLKRRLLQLLWTPGKQTELKQNNSLFKLVKCEWIVNGDNSSWFLLKGLWFTQKCLARGTKPTHISTIVFEDLCGCYKTLCPKCWRTGSFWEGCFVNAGSFEQQTRWDGQREPSTVLTAKQCHPQKHNE